MHINLEIACNSYQSCLHAQQGGADRIELFENIHEGGCTPTYGMIKQVKAAIKIPVYVMIRPRGGNFLYTNDEFEIMESDIKVCHIWGVQGVVFGILNADGTIDKKRCAHLLSRLGTMKATFHRAIDRTEDIYQAVEDCIELGFERILTSGGKKNVEEGKEILKDLQQKYGSKIIIMPGCGVSSDNIASIVQYTGVSEIHATAKSMVENTMDFIKNEFADTTFVSNSVEIKTMRNNLII